MTCQFCAELNHADEHGRWWPQGDSWAIGPTVGHFVPGYLLLVPNDHYQALAEAPAPLLAQAVEHVGYARGILARRYGPVIVAEHGSGDFGDRGAACCDHAHLHFIPIREASLTTVVKSMYLSRDNRPRKLDSLHDIAEFSGKPYLYLSTEPGEHLVWPLDESNRHLFPSQFVRRACAAALSKAEWDWRKSPMLDAMRRTRDDLAPAFSGAASTNWN